MSMLHEMPSEIVHTILDFLDYRDIMAVLDAGRHLARPFSYPQNILQIRRIECERQEESWNRDGIDHLAEVGDLEGVKYFCRKNLSTFDGQYRPLSQYEEEDLQGVMNSASANGHIHVVKYLHDLGVNWDTYTNDLACFNGHVEMATFLFERGQECSHAAVYNVAWSERLDILKLLQKFVPGFFNEVFLASHYSSDFIKNNI